MADLSGPSSLPSSPVEEGHAVQTVLRENEQFRAEAAQRDLERLQGAWGFVTGRREARLVVTGNSFAMRFANGEAYSGTFSLDPTCRPREMDLQIDEGREGHRGKQALAIYQFDGDHLIWATGEPGSGQRPDAFPHEPGGEHLCIIFRREPA
jgi:uncharacterized protein (TIGR03067 family)